MLRARERDDEMIIIMIVIVEFLNALLRLAILCWSGFLDARAVFRIVMERVDILIAISFYLHSNCTVQVARQVTRVPAIELTNFKICFT